MRLTEIASLRLPAGRQARNDNVYMCLAYPGKIEKILGDRAVVDFSGIKKEANISFVKVKKGDYAIVHAGFAIQRMTSEEAIDAIKVFNN